MAAVELRVARIGNSRGVRLPAAALRRYGIGAAVVMEERSDGILLRRPGPAIEKLSWAETARAMADSDEDWRDLEVTQADGLDELSWQPTSPRAASKARPPKKVERQRRGRS